MNKISNLYFALKEIRKTSKEIFFLMLVLTLCDSSIAVIDVFLLKFLIDYALIEKIIINRLICGLVIYFCLISFLKWFSELFKNVYLQKFEIEMMTRVKQDLYCKIEKIDLIDYCDSQFLDKLDRAMKQIGRQYFSVMVEVFVLLARLLTFITIFTFYRDNVLLFATLVNVANYIVYYFIVEKEKYNFDKKEECYFRGHEYLDRVFFLREYAQELRLVDGIKEVLIKKDDDNTHGYLRRFDVFIKKYSSSAIIMNSVNNLIFCITSIYVSWKLFNRTMSIGDFFVAINVVTCMSTQIIDIIKVIPSLYNSSLMIDDIREVLEWSSTFSENEDGMLVGIFESLDFANIFFKYDTVSDFSIHDLNFSINRNELVAIVGLNGSGKSTLMDIIMGLIKPQSGTIYLNGISYEEYNLSSFHDMFSVVFQDFQIYEISIAENILMHEIMSEEDIHTVEEALKFVGLYDKVMSMKNGIYSTIGQEENDAGFSGGERQKIAIARAYAQPSQILLFDEPTSALDVFVAEEFYDALFRLKQQNKTILYTTHKLQYTVNVDKILYIKEGTVSESGTHQELMKLNKDYAYLYRMK